MERARFSLTPEPKTATMTPMEKFFLFFGKLVFILLLTGILVGGGFYLGRKTVVPFPWIGAPAPSPTPDEPMPTPSLSAPAATSSATTPTKNGPRTVTAGLPTASGLSFNTYVLTVPDGWTSTKDHDETAPTDTLTLTKGQYQIKIYQAATGGNACLYPGDPSFEGPSSKYDTFVTITADDTTTYRRSGTVAGSGGKKTYTVCQKGPDRFQAPTKFGHITFVTPTTADETTLKDMDAMIVSLKKQ